MLRSLNLPRDEEGRLAALASYDILDTPRERDFDEIALLASEICRTPIAVVNLIGPGRQFFKAEVGLGVRETPLDSSFCAKAILEQEFLIVPDATKDARFKCNPLVTSAPNLRFYAGALLKTDQGHAIGTLCVLDFKPRDLTPVQQQTLRVLARQVMKQLELRRALQAKNEAEAQQHVLNEELRHRLKNTLAMVQAIASQTLKNIPDRDAVEAFERRILALSKAHDVLLQENWTAAPMDQITRLVLSMHDDAGRIETAGPSIQIGPKATLSLSLLLHELATNAAKYGSLSASSGRVKITWKVQAGESEPELVLTWEEANGPPVVPPQRVGFGSRLIRMGLAGAGQVKRDYLPGGFRAEFRAPLELVRAS
jgi:two-component sensor histidine kinase